MSKYCSCALGSRIKTRIEYKEKYGGKPCEGEPEATEPCKEDDCPGKHHLELFFMKPWGLISVLY